MISVGLILKTGHKGETAFSVQKSIPHTWVDMLALLSVEATGVFIQIGNTEIFLAPLY
jgi:hypothetical protein